MFAQQSLSSNAQLQFGAIATAAESTTGRKYPQPQPPAQAPTQIFLSVKKKGKVTEKLLLSVKGWIHI